MKILNIDENEGFANIRIENEDDLWFLKDWLIPEDKVRKHTHRTKLDGREKKACKLSLEIEKINYQRERLRLTGEITEAVEDVELGYHTFNLEADDENLKVWKKSSDKETWEMLEEAENKRSYEVLFVLIEKGSADFYLVRESGIQDLSSVDENIPGKMYDTDTEGSDFHNRIKEIVERTAGDVDNVVICGPGHEKNKLKKRLSEKISKKSFLQDTSVTGHTGLNEAIKRGALKKVVESSRISKETENVQEFFQRLREEDKATFGEPVKEYANKGAVEKLLITSEMKRKNPELPKKVKQMGGDVQVVNTDHESGERLKEMSGIAALLRYEP